MENKVRIKIGEIEFEAEGASEVIERERSIFFSEVLPAAVDAITRTKIYNENQIVSQSSQETLTTNALCYKDQMPVDISANTDLSRTSLAMFLNDKGDLIESTFVIMAAYFDEKKNGNKTFTIKNVEQYYTDARRVKSSNISAELSSLVKKSYIMEADGFENKKPKHYTLTDSGIYFVENYKPKVIPEKSKSKNSHKARPKATSLYASLSADDLNLPNYPEIKKLKSFKEQMMLIMYIVINENKGDSFSVSDIQYLLTDIIGLPATAGQVGGVFNDNKTWFKTEPDETNKRSNRKILLQGGKDFAQSLIAKFQTN